MKKFMNDADAFVRESLEGRVLLQPELTLLTGTCTVVRRDALVTDENRATLPVALLSGGGAGHEPAHAGYVASGMLAAAVSGGVFSSPSVDDVLDGIRAVTGEAGCLLIVKSYTGDRLNFGMAAELARAEGLHVEMVVVGDDVSLGDDDTHAGRRGLAGTVLVHKAAGASAATGANLETVTNIARSVAGRVGTMGVGFTGATSPSSSGPGFELADDEIELGLGIHGEPGVERTTMRTSDELADLLVERIATDRSLEAEQRVVALVGTAGATPPAELDILARSTFAALEKRKLIVERLWSGPVMTSLDMAGGHVALLAVDDALLNLLDAPTSSPAWPGETTERSQLREAAVPSSAATAIDPGSPDAAVRSIIDAVCERLLAARAELDAADQHVGDGDLGSALARGAQAWLEKPVEGSAPYLLDALSQRCRRTIGGTSGPLYGMLLLRASQVLADGGSWGEALQAGVEGVRELGGASPGEGTMVDALQPAADAVEAVDRQSGGAPDMSAILEAARDGAARTAAGVSTKGRASYVGGRAQGHEDPGASAVVLWMQVIAEKLS